MINHRTALFASAGTLPALPQIERISREVVDTAAYRHRLPRPGPSYAAIQITLGGRGALWHPDGRIEAIPRGRALCLLTGRSHFTYGLPDNATEPWDFVFVQIFGSAAISVLAELVARTSPVLRLDPEHPLVTDLVHRLPARGSRVTLIPAGENAALAMSIIGGLVDQQRDAAAGEDHLPLAAMELLRTRLADPPSIAAVAAKLGVSREHLTRAFTVSCGESPARWLRHQRLFEADRLVREGAAPIAEIARNCGFATASHFIHSFRKQYGQTPIEHRRRHASAGGR
ncbi:MAG: helix-turn-helix transcriptional regulator [Planctomycetes bacterium]|nr:helix-turn-helix transcriptional regulator [Planctomycetota bacterium]